MRAKDVTCDVISDVRVWPGFSAFVQADVIKISNAANK